MKNIDKKINNTLIIMIIWSILAVAGIPGIVLGAINKLWILMAFSILLTVTGFYGLPLGWVSFGSWRGRKAVFYAITRDELTEIEDIANNCGKSTKDVLSSINVLITKQYLIGYKFNKEKTEISKFERIKKVIIKSKCPNCGATIPVESIDCPYCKSVFDHQ